MFDAAHAARVAVLRLGRVSWPKVEALQQALVTTRVASAGAVRDSHASDSNNNGCAGGKVSMEPMEPIGNAQPGPAIPDDVLLLCEHPPVYTTGRRMEPNLDEQTRLEALGAEYVHCKRGGQTTFHGPGQIVGYPIVDLRRRGSGSRWFVNALEETMIRTCADFGVVAGRSEHTGVWVGSRKIGAIGIQVSRGVTWHGFALNCTTDLSWFRHIVPCGIDDAGVTSISAETGKLVTLADVEDVIAGHFVDCLLDK
eukprot:m.71649 g.71649  ORF g.71649 m.71649 type:complete len:254 (-) comp8728_c0_seq1:123-884(-)